MAQAVIDSLASSIGELAVYIIQLQEANAEAPPQIANNGGPVVTISMKLAEVAHNTANGEFANFPDIAQEINDEANKVEQFAGDLGKALDEVVVSTDRHGAYQGVLTSCKQIARSTTIMLILVYGGRIKAISRLADEAIRLVLALKAEADKGELVQPLADAVMAAAGGLEPLIKEINMRARDVDDDEKVKMQDYVKTLTADRAGCVEKFNGWSSNPGGDGQADMTGHCDTTVDDIKGIVKAISAYYDANDGRLEPVVDRTPFIKANKESAAALRRAGDNARHAVPDALDAEAPLLMCASELATAASKMVADVQVKDADIEADKQALELALGELEGAVGDDADGELKDELLELVKQLVEATQNVIAADMASAAKQSDDSLASQVTAANAKLAESIESSIKAAKERKAAEDKKRDELAAGARADAHDGLVAATATKAAKPGPSTSLSEAEAALLAAANKLLEDATMAVDDIPKSAAAVEKDTAAEDGDAGDVDAAAGRVGDELAGSGSAETGNKIKELAAAVVAAEKDHVAACTAAAGTPKDPAANAAVAETTQALVDATTALTAAVGAEHRDAALAELKEASEIAAAAETVEPEGPAKDLLVAARDVAAAAESAVRDIGANSDAVGGEVDHMTGVAAAAVAAGKAVAAVEDDADARARVIAGTTAVSDASSELAAAAAAAAADPDNLAAQIKVDDASFALSAAVTDLAAVANEKNFNRAHDALAAAAAHAKAAADDAMHQERAFLENARVIADSGVRLLDATGGSLGDADASSLAADSKALNDQVLAFVNSGKAAAKAEDNADEKAAIQTVTKAIAGEAAGVIKAGVAAVTNPKDYEAKATLDQKSEALAEAIEGLVARAAAARRREKELLDNMRRTVPFGVELEGEVGAIDEALDASKGGDGAASLAAGKKALANGRALQAALDELSLRTSDPNRKKVIQGASAAVLAAADGLEAAVNALESSPDDAAAAAAVTAAIEELSKVSKEALKAVGADAAVSDLVGAAHTDQKVASMAKSEGVADMLEAAADAANAAAAMVGNAKADPAKLADDRARAEAAVAGLESAAAVAALSLGNPETEAAVAETVEAIKATLGALADASADLTNDEDSFETNDAVRAVGAELAQLFTALANDTREKKARGIAIRDGADDTLAAAGKVKGGVDANDAAAVEASIKAAVDAAEELEVALNRVAGETSGPTAEAIEAATKALKDALADTVGTAGEWRADTGDADKKAAVLASVAALVAATAAAAAAAAAPAASLDLADTAADGEAVLANNPSYGDAEKDVIGAVNELAAKASTMVGDIKGNAGGVPGDADAVAGAVSGLEAAVAARLAACPDADEAAALSAALDNVKDKAGVLCTASKAAASDPEDAAKAGDVASASEALNNALAAMLAAAAARDRADVRRERDALAARLESIEKAANTIAGSGGAGGEAAAAAAAAAVVAAASAALLKDSTKQPDKVSGDADAVAGAGGKLGAVGGAPASAAAAAAAAASLADGAKASAGEPGDSTLSHKVNDDARDAADKLEAVIDDVLADGRDAATAAVKAAGEEAAASASSVPMVERPVEEASAAVAAATVELLTALAEAPESVEAVSQKVTAAVAALETAAKDAGAEAASSTGGAAAPGGSSSREAQVALAADVAAVIAAANDTVTASKTAAMSGTAGSKANVNNAASGLAAATSALTANGLARQEADAAARRSVAKDAILAAAEVASQPSPEDTPEMKALEDAVKAYAAAAADLVGTPASDTDAVKSGIEATKPALAAFKAAAEAVAATEENEAHRGMLNDCVAAIEDATNDLVESSEALTANPRDTAAEDGALAGAEAVAESLGELAKAESRDRHDRLAAKLKAGLGGLALGGLDDLPNMGDLLGLANDLSNLLGNLVGDIPDLSPENVARTTDRLKEMGDNLKSVARMVALECKDDNVKALVDDFAKGMDKAIAEAIEAANRYAADPSPENDAAFMEVMEGIDDAVHKFGDGAEDIAKTLGGGGGGGGGAEDVIETIANEVDAHIKNMSPEAKDDPIVILGTELSELMAQLAQAARDGNRTAIIKISRAIFDLCKKTAKECRAVAAACTDGKLKNDVVNAAAGMQNYSVQLKIIASVKAASEETDPTAENQLITCCQGIASCMEQAMDASVSAAIRAGK